MGHLSFWAFFLVIIGVVVGTLLLGFRSGQQRHRAHPDTPEGPIAAVVGSVLGLLAFMLAFSFSLAADRYSARKQLLLEEVNAIGTVALRADLLPEPHRSACRELLVRYVDGRLHVAQHVEDLPRILEESQEIHQALWAHALALEPGILNADIGNLFVDAHNNLVQLHRSRVTVAVYYHVPPAVWTSLMILLALSMLGVGYQFGITGRHNWMVFLIMALGFAVVLALIRGLDNTSGDVVVDQKPMIQLQQELARPQVMRSAP